MSTIRAFPKYLDGYYFTPRLISRRPRRYPFRGNGDIVSDAFDETFLIFESAFAPTAAGTAHADLSGYYLIDETPVEIVQGDLGTFRRTYAKVPTTQTVEDTEMVTRPSPGLSAYPGVLGSYRIFKPDTTIEKYDAYLAKTVTGDTGVPAFYPNGGTYTLTFGGDTTGALNYNDSAATVSTAFNALAAVTNRGGATLGGSYNSAGGITVAFSDYAQITIASGSLTGGTIVKSESKTNGGYSQTVGAALSTATSVISGATSGLTLASVPSGGAFFATDTNLGGARRSFRILTYSPGGAVVITGGTYTITISSATTAALAYNATFAEIETALNALGVGSFTVGTAGMESEAYNSTYIQFVATWVAAAPTGGTYTLTVGADTTGSIAHNASAAAVSTALNALTSVTNRGGCTVSGSLGTGFAIAFANAAITANAASLTPSGSTVTPGITDGAIGKAQAIGYSSPSSTRDLYIALHGIEEGGAIFLKSGSTYYYPVASYTVVSANAIRLAVSASDSWASASTITEAGVRTKANYEPGSAPTLVSAVTRFSLSAITPDTYQGADAVFLQQIFSGNTAINYRVGDSKRWPSEESPIRSLTTVKVSAANL